MAATHETLLEIPAGFGSAAAARTMAQMDDQTRRLLEATRDMSAAELEWQPAPGANSIGMLLTHIAVAEVHMTDVGLARLANSDVPAVLGLRTDDDGLPLPPEGRPPAILAGHGIEWFHELLRKSRAHTRGVAMRLTDEDLPRLVTRPRPDGSTRVFSVDWMLYHLLEHQAGHLGQILLLRHLCRVRAGA